MSEEGPSWSRRQWVGMAAVAALGSPLLRATTEPPKSGGINIYNVRDFGAKGDGVTIDTRAVQAAIDACAKDHGGIVLVPAGDFVIGTIELKSNITLHIASAGKLLGSPEINDYHAGSGIPRSNGNIVMVSAADCDNVAIEGLGTIDGNGAKFYNGKGDNTGPGQNSGEGYFQRPHLMVFYRCRNLLLRDVFLTASAYHCCRILNCKYVKLEGVRIHNRVNKNNDGFHINSSEYVGIVNCHVACQDDACALFGSNKFVTVTNCSFSTRWSIFRFGNGECENVAISNCLIYETYGCPIKMRCGAHSRIENVSFSNIVMKDVTGPISIGLDSRSRRAATSAATSSPASQPSGGVVRNISFNNIRATVVAEGRQHADLPFPSAYRDGERRQCIVVNGVGAETIENISFNDVHVIYEGGGTAEEANRAVPQIAGEYFEIGTPSAFGMYARNVRGLTLNDVRFETTFADERPAVVFEHVQDAAVNGISATGHPNAALLRLVETRQTLVTAPRLLSPARVFIRVEGPLSEGITVDGGDFSAALKDVELSAGVNPSGIKVRA